ncbi:MAG: hypothetical protein Q9O62_01745 [Ardenticatenia bacterium]|nr:hypothetical protein [Ardenticatenia bacterium]
MVAQTAAQLAEHLRALKEQRKNGALDMRAYYRELLVLTGTLVKSLVEEATDISEEELLTQVPLLLVFIEEQVRKLGERE